MSRDLPRSAAADQQVDPAAVLAFVDAVEADPAIELHSLMVVRNGHVVAEGWWAPHTPERTRLLYSVSKSFTSTALGMALAEGRFGLDDTVVSHVPELDAEITDPRSRSITVRHLASMASGHNRDLLDEVLARDPREPVRGFQRIPLWKHLLAGLGAGRPDGAAQPELDKRLTGLSLPPCVARPSPPRWEDWTGRPFPVASEPRARRRPG